MTVEREDHGKRAGLSRAGGKIYERLAFHSVHDPLALDEGIGGRGNGEREQQKRGQEEFHCGLRRIHHGEVSRWV